MKNRAAAMSDVVKRAWALRVQPAVGGPFIRDWLVCGPYRQAEAVGAVTVFNLIFGPERGDDDILWYTAPPGDTMPLAAFFPGEENCVAYLKADWTNYDPVISATLESWGRSGIPLYLYYPPEADSQVTVLPQILSIELVLDTLRGAPQKDS